MTVAKKLGVKAGRAVGWVGATAWKGTVMLAESAGEAGSGFLEGTEQGWEERCKVLDERRARNRALLLAKKAGMEAAALTAKTEPVAA